MARWTKASRLLRCPQESRVLDLGCAFGFGTRLLVDRYETYGHDLNAAYIAQARKSVPGATFTLGPAHQIPYPDGFFHAVLLLDVLEHVPDERAVVTEIARVLHPGGQCIVSVPNRGALAALDSLNMYRRIMGDASLPPTDDPSWRKSPYHRHYDVRAILRLFGRQFDLCSARYSGLGLAEPVNLILLLLFRAMLPAPRLYNVLQYLYFGVYLAEDLVPMGRYGYHLMLDLKRR